MNRTDLENKIISLVTLNNGLKGADLTVRLLAMDLITSNDDIYDVIFDMIQRGDLIEIEYVIPRCNSKSFLVPKGTIINRVKVR